MVVESHVFIFFFPHVANGRHYLLFFRVSIDKPLKSTTLCQNNHQKILLRQNLREFRRRQLTDIYIWKDRG